MATLPTRAILTRKLGVIAYMSVVNFATISVLAQLLERYVVTRYDPMRARWRSRLDLARGVVAIAFAAYLARQIAEVVPKPFRTDAFDPDRVKEVKGSVLTAFSFFIHLGDDLKTFLPLLDLGL